MKKLDNLGVGDEVISLHRDGYNARQIQEHLGLEDDVSVQTVRNYIKDWSESDLKDEVEKEIEEWQHYGDLAETGFEGFVDDVVGKLENLFRNSDNIGERRRIVQAIRDTVKKFSKIRQEKKSVEVNVEKRVEKILLEERRKELQFLCPKCKKELANNIDEIDEEDIDSVEVIDEEEMEE